VGADDSSEEDVLRNHRSKRRKDPPPPVRKPVRPASPPEPDPEEAQQSPASARGKRRACKGGTSAIDLDADDDDVELDPAYLERKREIDLQRKLLAAKAYAVELPDDDEDDEPQEVVNLSRPVAAPPPQPPAPEPPSRKLLLKVRTAAQAEPMPVRIYYDKPFEKLIVSLAHKAGVEVARVKLRFDGDLIKPTQTPADFDMEEDDMLDFTVSG
jgi:hypothetical protein